MECIISDNDNKENIADVNFITIYYFDNDRILLYSLIVDDCTSDIQPIIGSHTVSKNKWHIIAYNWHGVS